MFRNLNERSEHMSFDYSKLRGKIREKCKTESVFSELLGISRVSLSHRLSGKLDFSQTEIQRCCEILGIDKTEINKYFFTKKV